MCVEKKYFEAEQKALKAVTLFEKNKLRSSEYGYLLITLSEIYIRLKKYTDALNIAKKAKSVFIKIYGEEHPYTILCWSNIAVGNLLLGKVKLAETQLQYLADRLKNKFGAVSIDYLTTLGNLSELYLIQGNRDKCESTFTELISVYTELLKQHYPLMNSNERVSFINKHYVNQQILYNYLAKYSDHNPAFLILCFEFRNFSKWTLIDAPCNTTNEQIGFHEIQNSIPDNEAVIEIIRCQEVDLTETGNVFYLFFVITSETCEAPILKILKNGTELEGKYFNEYSTAINRKAVDFNSYDRYWKHLENIVFDKEVIIISPDKVYRNVNLSTLNSERGTDILDEKQIIIYHDIRNIVQANNVQLSWSKKAILIGNPIFYDDDLCKLDDSIESFLPQLPGSEVEVNAVSSILSNAGWVTRVYTGDNITKSIFETTSDIGLMHIATHGRFENAEYEPGKIDKLMYASGLFLSHPFVISENKIKYSQEGYLYGKDVLQMDLRNVEIVLLSSCDSGGGVQLNLGETFGFQRTFLLAGAKSIMMSLWKIEDSITLDFMTRFYENLVSNYDKAESFSKAQKFIKQKYRHPFYWGAFVLIHR